MAEQRKRSIGLMYHDVYRHEPVAKIPGSAAMYHVSERIFGQHLQAIRASGLPVMTVSEYLSSGPGDSVVLTFDDGWRGAFETAMPLLLQSGFKATFFITRDLVGRQGFCHRDLIAAAAEAGMEIGVHGTTHRMLSECPSQEVLGEFSHCKRYLESFLGEPVVSASVPGGDWTSDIAAAAKQSGLKSLCTSRPGVNRSNTSPLSLRRIAIRRETSAADVRRYCRFQPARELVRWVALQLPRQTLGMKTYSLLRRRLLGEPTGTTDGLFKP